MKKRMIASKAFRYGTRALQAGDVFEAPRGQARTLVAIGRATEYAERTPAKVSPPPADLEVQHLDGLREKARSVGIKPDARWSAATLERKIAEASS